MQSEEKKRENNGECANASFCHISTSNFFGEANGSDALIVAMAQLGEVRRAMVG
jgi:hypothetical protein